MILRGNVFSKSLRMETGITIITPDTAASGPPHKAAYLLHGVCGSNTDFTDFTMLPVYAAGYDCIFIMPDAHRSFYTDMVYGHDFFHIYFGRTAGDMQSGLQYFAAAGGYFCDGRINGWLWGPEMRADLS